MNMSAAEPFNEWRRKYDGMSYDSQVAAHRKFWMDYPQQVQFNAEEILIFFLFVRLSSWKVTGDVFHNVLELGGWKGEMAKHVLSQFPLIKKWHNIELCEDAIKESVCDSEKYSVEILPDFFWKADFNAESYDVLVLSHIVEHIKATEFVGILEKAKWVKYLYIDAPIADLTSEVDWTDYAGTHVLEIGWRDLHALILKQGFTKMWRAQYQTDGSIGVYIKLGEVHG